MKLNIGSGRTQIEGFTPIDRMFGSEAFPLPYETGSVEEIRASHVLEHFSFRDVQKALAEWIRVLKPGGTLRVAVPDFDKLVLEHRNNPQWPFILMGGQTDENDFHRSVFDYGRLYRELEHAGFVGICRWEDDGLDTASHSVSLRIEGRKPDNWQPPQEAQDIRIKAIMSLPRVAWTDNFVSIIDSLRPWNIPIETFNGVFWGQCMQRAFNTAVEQGVDWLLTIDFDTLFTAGHLDRLLHWFGTHPEIDALAPLQMRRGKEFPLMTIKGESQTELTGKPVRVDTAHFGLTLIRVDAIKDVPKPWFASQPGPTGEWDDDRIDDDIWFWFRWKDAGKTVYVAPDVNVGHLELMSSEYGPDCQPRHVYVGDWREQHRREGR